VSTLEGRSYELVVAPLSEDQELNNLQTGLDLSALDVEFRVKKTLKPKPNTAHIKVWGLSRISRQYLQTTKKLTVRLAAGYAGENELLFLGETRSSYTQWGEKGDITTVIETGDSEKDMTAAGLSLTFGAQTTISQALKAVAASLPNQAPMSAVDKFMQPSEVEKLVDAFFGKHVFHPAGGAIDRQTTRYLSDLCRSAGLEWSIQNGTIIILEKDKPLAGKEIVIGPDSGMIGSPSVDRHGLLDVKSLIVPGLHPGAKIYVDAQGVKGNYRVESAEYLGNSSPSAKDWYVKMACSQL